MDKIKSLMALREAIGGELYVDHIDATVKHGNALYTYSNIFFKVNYDVRYKQLTVSIVWEDDASQPDYQKLGLHGTYNTNYQEFIYENGTLRWEDGSNTIMIKL